MSWAEKMHFKIRSVISLSKSDWSQFFMTPSQKLWCKKVRKTYTHPKIALFILGGIGGSPPPSAPKLFDQNLPEYCVKDFKVIFHCRI